MKVKIQTTQGTIHNAEINSLSDIILHVAEKFDYHVPDLRISHEGIFIKGTQEDAGNFFKEGDNVKVFELGHDI